MNSMKAWLKGFQFGPIRWQFSPEWWEKQRAKGKARFIAHGAITGSVTYVGLTAMVDGIFGGAFSISLFQLILWTGFGIPIAAGAWSENENRYNKALHEAGYKVLPRGNSITGQS